MIERRSQRIWVLNHPWTRPARPSEHMSTSDSLPQTRSQAHPSRSISAHSTRQIRREGTSPPNPRYPLLPCKKQLDLLRRSIPVFGSVETSVYRTGGGDGASEIVASQKPRYLLSKPRLTVDVVGSSSSSMLLKMSFAKEAKPWSKSAFSRFQPAVYNRLALLHILYVGCFHSGRQSLASFFSSFLVVGGHGILDLACKGTDEFPRRKNTSV
jgi:hypothetical protein